MAPVLPSPRRRAPQQLYDPEQVAKKLRVTRRTVDRWINIGAIDTVKVGGARRVRYDVLEQITLHGLSLKAE